MRIVHINVTAAFSTGRIAVELCRQAMREGHRALLCYARGSCPWRSTKAPGGPPSWPDGIAPRQCGQC